ncbi:MAG: uroporphyrinogen decarboxylase [Planctomycetota bacterium]
MTTSKERFLAALRCESVDRPPAWFMRQAGRYLPEYRALRKGQSFTDTLADPARSAEITLQPIRRYGMDAAVIFSDILVPLHALGMGLEFVEGKGPVLEPAIREASDVAALREFDPNVATRTLGDALRIVRKELGDERALIGFCGAPFTVASYAVEGGSSRDFAHTKKMLFAEPATFERLLARVTEAQIPYLAMQVEAGADALQIFDSWGGALDAVTYRRVVLPHLKKLVAGAKSTGVPVILYVNGGGHLIEALLETEPDCLSIDWRIDPKEARRKVGAKVALQGNIDPCVLLADRATVERETRRTLDAFAGHAGHVFNVGSGLIPSVPPEAVGWCLEVVRSAVQ